MKYYLKITLLFSFLYVNYSFAQPELCGINEITSTSKLNIRGQIININTCQVDLSIISFESVEKAKINKLWWMDINTKQAHEINPDKDLAKSNAQLSWCPVKHYGKVWYAFISSVEGNYNIYIGNTTDNYFIQLTCDTCNNDYPQWSPDGDRLVYCSSNYGGSIYLVENLKKIIEEGINRSKIKKENEDYGIFIIKNPCEEIKHIRLSRGIYSFDTFPSWSHDGNSIIFESTGNSEIKKISNLYYLDVRNKPIHEPELLHENLNNDEIQPVWSPDQKKIAYYTTLSKESSYINFIDVPNGFRSIANAEISDCIIKKRENSPVLWTSDSKGFIFINTNERRTSLNYLDIITWQKNRKKEKNPGITTLIPESDESVINEVAGQTYGSYMRLFIIVYEHKDYYIKSSYLLGLMNTYGGAIEKKISYNNISAGFDIMPTLFIGDAKGATFEYGNRIAVDYLFGESPLQSDVTFSIGAVYGNSYLVNNDLKRTPVRMEYITSAFIYRIGLIFASDYVEFNLGVGKISYSGGKSNRLAISPGVGLFFGLTTQTTFNVSASWNPLNENAEKGVYSKKDSFITIYAGLRYLFSL